MIGFSSTHAGAVAALLLLGACASPDPEAQRAGQGETREGAATPAGAPAALDVGSAAQRAAVDEWYLPVEGGCRLYVRELGVGDTVVVVHGGFGAEHSYMLDAFVGLEDRFHFVFYDQRGSLRSPCPDSLVSVDAHVSDLEAVRAAAGIERADIVAHSMGTFLAMRYLAEHPGRAGRLMLVAPQIPRGPETEEEQRLYAAQQRDFGEWAEARTQERWGEEGLDRPDSLLTARERTHKWRISFAAGNLYNLDRWRLLKGGQAFFDAGAGQAAARTMGRWDFTDDLAAHPYPVTFLLGDHDLIGFGGELHRAMLDGLGGVRLELLERAGHNSWIDRPDAFRGAVLRALTDHESPTAAPIDSPSSGG